MNNLVIKNNTVSKSQATTITIKVPADFKISWDKWAIDNNVNKSKTLVAVLKHIMK